MKSIHLAWVLGGATLCCFFAHAQTTQDAATATDAPASAGTGRVEFEISGASLTAGNSSWSDQSFLGFYSFRPGSTVNWQLSHERHYGESGTVGALSYTHEFNPDWYGSLGISRGTALFHSKRRADIGLFRKWGEKRQWVTGLAYMNSRSGDDVHRDQGITASIAHYSEHKLVTEAGLIFNRSNPGGVTGTRGFMALTYGADKQQYVVFKVDHGKEAYLPAGAYIDGIAQQVDFRSTEATLKWRKWLGAGYGVTLGGQYYRNPYYNRKSVSASVFVDF